MLEINVFHLLILSIFKFILYFKKISYANTNYFVNGNRLNDAVVGATIVDH